MQAEDRRAMQALVLLGELGGSKGLCRELAALVGSDDHASLLGVTARAEAMIMLKAYNEQLHPRDAHGRWRSGLSGAQQQAIRNIASRMGSHFTTLTGTGEQLGPHHVGKLRGQERPIVAHAPIPLAYDSPGHPHVEDGPHAFPSAGDAERFDSNLVRKGDTVIDTQGNEWLVHGTSRYAPGGGSSRERGLSVRPVEGGRARVMSERNFVAMRTQDGPHAIPMASRIESPAADRHVARVSALLHSLASEHGNVVTQRLLRHHRIGRGAGMRSLQSLTTRELMALESDTHTALAREISYRSG